MDATRTVPAFADHLVGQTIERVEQQGNSLIIRTDGDLTLYVDSPTLYGNETVCDECGADSPESSCTDASGALIDDHASRTVRRVILAGGQ